MRLLKWLALASVVASSATAATYNRFDDVVRNTSGRTVSGASVYVYVADTDSLAAIYSNGSGTTAKSNPTSSDSAGRFWFYAPAGKYDIAVSRYGIERYTMEDVAIGLLVDGDVTFGGSLTVTDSLRVMKAVKGNLSISGNLSGLGSIISGGLIFGVGDVTSAAYLVAQGNQVRLGGSAYPSLVRGSGSPEGVVVASPGAYYCNTTGSGTTAFYGKASGAGNTGWVPLYIDKTSNQTFTGNVTVEDTVKVSYIRGTLGAGYSSILGDVVMSEDLQVLGDLDVTGNDVSLAGAVMIKSGEGSPEGVVTAPMGCLYLNRLGGASTTLYVKQSGSGNTGWVAK